jgi:hypothetical protein
MLAGRPPFEDTDPLSIMTAHVSRDPPTFASVAPDLKLPAGLEQVIMRGLEKVSSDRTGSAGDYQYQLDTVLRGAGFDVAPSRGSGHVIIPTPPPGSLLKPQAIATPMPFSTSVASPSMSLATLLEGSDESRARRAVSLADVSEPIPRKWLVIAGIVLLAAIIIAIVLKIGAKKSTDHDAPPPKHERRAEAEPQTPPPSPPAVIPGPGDMTVDRDTQLKAALLDLNEGSTCTDRRAAISKLVQLGDPRAIQPLTRARYRMRGGVLGIGDSNTNSCLKADAESAIKALGGTLGR